MILVTGASGSIGRPLVKQLQAGGHAFKAFVRSADKGRALDCEYVIGDFDASETIRAALVGIDRLFLNGVAVPSMVEQQKRVVDLAVAAGVRQIVKVSSAGVSPESKVAIGRWHAAIEAHLDASGVRWFSLRPSTFMQNLLRTADGVRRDSKIIGAFKNGRAVFVDAYDIAASGAALLTGPERESASFVITGGEALTYADVAAKLSAKLGRTIQYVDVPVEQLVAGAKKNGVPAQLAEDFGAMMTSIAEGRSGRPSMAVKELTGREPRTLDQFLDENLDAFR